jgi:hypothetical protein
LSAGGPCSITGQTRAADGGAARLTNGDAGSMDADHASRNDPSARRVFNTICTGPAGSGKRSDSWNARDTDFASSVVSHFPIDRSEPARVPRAIGRPVGHFAKKYLPRFVSSRRLCRCDRRGTG